MVFEQIIKERWIKRKEHAFFLAFFYSLLAIISAKLIFPKSIGLMSIAFTSMLLIPSLNALLAIEENEEIRGKKFSLKRLWKDHNDILRVYLFLFLGIFLAYGLFILFFEPQTVELWFAPQLNAAGITGSAIYYPSAMLSIIKNNLIIFAVCFILSLVYGAGSIIFITWNASVWGVVFAFFAKLSSHGIGLNPFDIFFAKLVPFLPHMLTEAIAYIGAAIVGGIVSKAIIRERLGSKKFNHVLTDALIVLVLGVIIVVIAGFIEAYFYGGFTGL